MYFTKGELAKRWKCSGATVTRRMREMNVLRLSSRFVRVPAEEVARYEREHLVWPSAGALIDSER